MIGRHSRDAQAGLRSQPRAERARRRRSSLSRGLVVRGMHSRRPSGEARVRSRGPVSPTTASSRRRGWSSTGTHRSADDPRGVNVQREQCPSGSATRESPRTCSETDDAVGRKTSDRPASRSGGVAWRRSVGSARRSAARVLHTGANLRRVAVGRARLSHDPLGAHPATIARENNDRPRG